MNATLEAPTLNASTADWKAWANDLREQPSTPAVRAALRRAQEVLNARKQPRHIASVTRGAFESD